MNNEFVFNLDVCLARVESNSYLTWIEKCIYNSAETDPVTLTLAIILADLKLGEGGIVKV